MNPGLLVALAAVGALVLAGLGLLLVDRGRLSLRVRTSQAAVHALNERVDQLAEEIEAARVVGAAARVVPRTEYLITRAGTADALEDEAAPVSNRAALSVSFGEPFVKAVAFAYGVRRALSPENRNRIAFEMRREVKRARKQHRRELKEARRDANAEHRSLEAVGHENHEDAA